MKLRLALALTLAVFTALSASAALAQPVVIAAIPILSTPGGVAANPVTNRVYVTEPDRGGFLQVIDGATNAIVDEIYLGAWIDDPVNVAPFGVAVSGGSKATGWGWRWP